MEEERLPTDPAPTVWPPPPTSTPLFPQELPQNGIDTFPAQNVFLVLLFTLLSLGIYSVLWLSRQVQRINLLMPDFRIDTTFVTVVLVVVSLSAGLDIVSIIVDNSTMATASKILDRIAGLLVLWLTFQVRGHIHRLLGRLQSGPYRYSALGTFFLGILYLQFKINRNHQRWERERPLEII